MGLFEDFVNVELPKRIATDEDGSGSGNLPVGQFLRTTGIGLLVETVDIPTLAASGVNALVGVDGITVISGTNVTTISGFRTEFVNASGSLAADLIIHTGIPDAHHEQTVINTTAFGAGVTIIGGGGTSIVTSGTLITISGATASGVITDHAALDNLDFNSSAHVGFASLIELLSVSGSLQIQIDAVEASDVDSINGAIGDLFIVGAGEVEVTTSGQIITVSGTPHTSEGTISDAIIGGVGITVTSGTSIITIDGHLRYTSAENPAIIGGTNVTVVSGVDTITISSTADSGTISDALIGVDGITVISGANITTISGFRTEFVNASGTLSIEIDTDIAIHAADPDAHHIRYTKDENDAILGTDGITIISGTDTITVSGFRTEFVSASGSLQIQIDNIVIASGVTDINLTAGSITITGAGEVDVTTDGQIITVSGTPHTTDTDTISDAIIAGSNISVVSGTDTITISSTASI